MSLSKLTDNKLFLAFAVPTVFTVLAWLSGVLSLPAAVQNHTERIIKTEGKVEILERNEIRRDERQQQLLDIVKEVRDEVKAMRRQR